MPFSRTNPANLLTLKNEILNDPRSLGYAAFLNAGDAGGLAARLNQIGASGETCEVTEVTRTELVRIVASEPAEYRTMLDVERAALQMVVTLETIPVRDPGIRLLVSSLFPQGTRPSLRQKLIAVQTRSCSRAEILFGDNTVLTHEDAITAARS